MKQQTANTLNIKTDPIENFYDLKEELGRGNFAVVKKCKHKDSDDEYAAKCITKKRTRASKKGMSKDAIENEATILLSVNHDGIIKLFDVFETRQNITLVMELLTGGELFEEVSKEEFILEKDACHYTKQVLAAVNHLHENNIIHLDLKPENIVLKNKGHKEIKLVDFGLARKIDPGQEIKEMMGTPEFAAPEVINFDPVGFYTDMWAIGVITYILLSGASPFLGDDDQETYENITTCDYEFDEEYFSKITENAKNFIKKLLMKNPRDRNTVDDCIKHPWIACEEQEDSIIDTKKIRAFVARRRWKQSLRMVTMISRLKVLSRNNTSSPSSDVSGDESDSYCDKENEKHEKPIGKSLTGDTSDEGTKADGWKTNSVQEALKVDDVGATNKVAAKNGFEADASEPIEQLGTNITLAQDKLPTHQPDSSESITKENGSRSSEEKIKDSIPIIVLGNISQLEVENGDIIEAGIQSKSLDCNAIDRGFDTETRSEVENTNEVKMTYPGTLHGYESSTEFEPLDVTELEADVNLQGDVNEIMPKPLSTVDLVVRFQTRDSSATNDAFHSVEAISVSSGNVEHEIEDLTDTRAMKPRSEIVKAVGWGYDPDVNNNLIKTIEVENESDANDLSKDLMGKQEITNVCNSNVDEVRINETLNNDVVCDSESPLSNECFTTFTIGSKSEEQNEFPTLVLTGDSKGFKIVTSDNYVKNVNDDQLNTEFKTGYKEENLEKPFHSLHTAAFQSPVSSQVSSRQPLMTNSSADCEIACESDELTELKGHELKDVHKNKLHTPVNSDGIIEADFCMVDIVNSEKRKSIERRHEMASVEIFLGEKGSEKSVCTVPIPPRDYEDDEIEYVVINAVNDETAQNTGKFRITSCCASQQLLCNEASTNSNNSGENFEKCHPNLSTASAPHFDVTVPRQADKEETFATTSTPEHHDVSSHTESIANDERVDLVFNINESMDSLPMHTSSRNFTAVPCDKSIVVKKGSKFVVQLLKSN